MAIQLSVIIPSYNTSQLTKNTLDSVIKAIRNEPFKAEVIVVDNGSTDSSPSMLSNYAKNVSGIPLRTIYNKTNLGYPRANNIGINEAKGDYLLFLNSDVITKNVKFGKLIDYLESDSKLAGLTVKVSLQNGSIDPASHRGFPTVWNSFCYFLKLEKVLGRIPHVNRIFGSYHLTYLDLSKVHEIDSPTGAFFLVKKKIIKDLRGFDEDFFMYGEDVDLAYRIKKMGYKIIYYPLYEVIHLKHVSGLKNSNELLQKKTKQHFYEAMKIFYRKHYSSNLSFLNNLVYFFIDFKRDHL